MGAKRGTLKERFMRSKIEKTSNCWWWHGAKWGRYGQIRDDGGKHMTAHRASYLIFVGPISPGLCVLHKCDNGLCVNPSHLWIGTHKENMQDRHSKGRTGGWAAKK